MFSLILEREEGGERETERERNIDVRNIDQLPPPHTPTGDWTQNLGMYLVHESNLQPFGVQGNASTNWATQPGQEKVHFT